MSKVRNAAFSLSFIVHFYCRLATNIALGDLETIVLLQPLLLDIMQRLAQPEFNIPFIKRQLAWLIGNMALSSDSCRDVLAGHVMPWLLQTLIQSEQRESKLESSPQVPRSVIAWALCNMLRGHSLLVLEQISKLYLQELFLNCFNSYFLQDNNNMY